MTGVSNGKISQDIGRLEGELSGIKDQLKHLQHHANETQNTVASIKESIDRAKGGWKMAIIFAGSGGMLGALTTKALPWLGVLPK